MLDSGMAEPKPTPTPDDAQALEDSVQKGVASLDQGRRVPYEKVRRWLLSWGTDRETPPPECP
jgi:predicted transcriptional regulator